MAKFKNKYRIESSRAQWWDYGSNAAYFVTINTKNRIRFFGEIVHEEMYLTELGKYVEMCWYQIPEHFPFVKLGEFVVMPDHIHGIVHIVKSEPKLHFQLICYFNNLKNLSKNLDFMYLIRYICGIHSWHRK